MLYSNKIHFPYLSTNKDYEESAKVVFKYYKSLGYEIVTAGVMSEDGETFLRSRSRNLAVDSTDEDIIILIDSDTMVPNAAIYQASEICKENDVVIRLAAKTLSVDSYGSEIAEYLSSNEIIPDEYMKNCSTTYLHTGCSWVLNRKTWEYLGGFNEQFVWYGYEDLEFNLRAARLSKLLFLDYDEITIANRKIVNFNKHINENSYEISKSIFFDIDKLDIVHRVGNAESKISDDFVEKIFDFNNYRLD